MKRLLVMSLLMFVMAGCFNNPDILSEQRLSAIKCAENWKTQGYNFDPNSMTCSQMAAMIQRIRKAEFWVQKGYSFDPALLTCNQMDQKIKDFDRAQYWRNRGYSFDPNSMTRYEMDYKAKELEEIKYWKNAGYYYDPNSKTVFLTNEKKTELSSLVGIHTGSDKWHVCGFSYSAPSRSKDYSSLQRSMSTYRLPGIAENGSYYGQISETTGRPKTVPVRGYFRKDGTYVRSHYRSSPR